jgi:hypothetical protein
MEILLFFTVQNNYKEARSKIKMNAEIVSNNVKTNKGDFIQQNKVVGYVINVKEKLFFRMKIKRYSTYFRME